MWKQYALEFSAPYGLPDYGTPRIGLTVTTGKQLQQVASGHFKLRREGFIDNVLGRKFDLMIISNIDIEDHHQRKGLGTEIVRLLAVKFPDVLFVGENQNAEALSWHKGSLEQRFPTRMIRLTDVNQIRVALGKNINPAEL